MNHAKRLPSNTPDQPPAENMPAVPPIGQTPTDLISPRKAAKLLGVHYATMYRWIWSGKLPAWDLCGLVRVSEADVRALVKPKPVKFTPPVKHATARQQARVEAWANEVLKRRGYG